MIEDLRGLLAGTFLADAPICPISNITGEGYEGFFDALNQVVAACEDRSSAGVFRVWVEDVFTIRGPGTVVTGIPSSGLVRIGDPLTLLPAGRAGHVRRMQVYGDDATEARAGECVALNLPEFGHEEVRRGMVLCASDAVASVTMAEAELRILDSVKGKVDDFFEAHLHVGTASVLARVAMLEETEMRAGQRQMVQLRLAEPLPLVPGDRFVVRANLPAQDQTGLATIGGGRILGVSNARLRRKKPWTLSALAARRDALDDPARWCELMLRESALPLSVNDLRKTLSAAARGTDGAAGETADQRPGRFAAERRADPQRCDRGDGCQDARGGAGLPHRQPPACGAGPRGAVLDGGGSGGGLRTGRRVAGQRQTARTPGHRVCAGRLERPDIRPRPAVERPHQRGVPKRRLGGSRLPPSSPPRSASRLRRVEKMIKLLVEKAVLVRLDERLCIHRDALEAAKQVALRLFGQKRSFSTMEFRDALGVSRKHAVPLVGLP